MKYASFCLALIGCASMADQTCTISDNEDGTVSMSCPDGSSYVLDGAETTTAGTDGTDGTDNASGGDPSFVYGDYTIENLWDIEALRGIERITGLLSIQDSTLTSLEDLPDLEVGSLSVTGTELVDFQGARLTIAPGGELWLLSNPHLMTLEGLDSLDAIIEEIYIGQNDSLGDINGLFNVPEVLGNITIQNNAALASVDGLSGIEKIGGNLNLSYNDLLQTAGLSGLESVDGYINISWNVSTHRGLKLRRTGRVREA